MTTHEKSVEHAQREREALGRREAYGLHEAAVMLGVSGPHLWRLISRGAVPSITLGKRRLITRATLDRILAGELG